MADGALEPMTADAFLAWAAEQPSGRFELVRGRVVEMAPEKTKHVLARAAVYVALRDAISAAGRDWTALPDGATVRIDAATVYEPDALATAAALDLESIEVAEPVILVEVASPSTRGVDAGAKLADYFRLPSLRHYLIVDPDRRVVIHHARGEDGRILTEVVREGALGLDALGAALAVDALFPEA